MISTLGQLTDCDGLSLFKMLAGDLDTLLPAVDLSIRDETLPSSCKTYVPRISWFILSYPSGFSCFQ